MTVSRYAKSERLLQRALKTIPLGSQTFSKAYTAFPVRASPLFLERGAGSHVWDVDGNEYIDFINGLLPVILGHNDPDVSAAAIEQIRRGVAFSLATPLEVELAERLTRLIPCAEMVRFGKNGSDATSAAIRIARASTGRERVAVCGYHGWQDWYIGATTRNKGVPESVRALTQKFPYNDLAALEALLGRHRGEFAAVMMEPMNVEEPLPGYLEGVRDLAHAHGALFILDEIISGFRFHIGGAQSLFGVTPDLATFGKSMGNGFPISAVVGKAQYMHEMEEIFFSGTFGGEAVSLAASIATIDKLQRVDALASIHSAGRRLIEFTGEGAKRHGLGECVRIVGHPGWPILTFLDAAGGKASEVKTLYLQEMIARGVLVAGSFNMSYAHSEADLERVQRAQDETFALLRAAIDSGRVRERLLGPPIEPVFRVR